ncbi:MAG TPA: hypothetical protein VIT43_05700, partial [Candidatus Dormibacteraeota bacterium]
MATARRTMGFVRITPFGGIDMKDTHDETGVGREAGEYIAVEEPMIFFRGPVVLEAPLTAGILTEVPAEERASMVARLLDLGAEAYTSFHALAGARQLEVYLETLGPKLTATLSQTMQTERRLTIEDVHRLLAEHDVAIAKAVTERKTLVTTGTTKGRPFEEAITAKLVQLTVPIGAQVQRCADNLGARRRRYGDHLITLNPETTNGQPLRIVGEVKSRSEDGQRFTFTAIRQICEQARVNRDAAACIFIADTAEILPDGLAFGQLSPVDYFTAFDAETGDDTGIAVAIRLAMIAALGT